MLFCIEIASSVKFSLTGWKFISKTTLKRGVRRTSHQVVVSLPIVISHVGKPGIVHPKIRLGNASKIIDFIHDALNL